jgi:hypothetical protein
MADLIQVGSNVYELTPLNKIEKYEVRRSLLLAKMHQKSAGATATSRAYAGWYTGKRYNRSYKPSVLVINRSDCTLRPYGNNAGSWSPSKGSTIYANSSRIRKIYDVKQLNVLVGKRFNVSSFDYRGRKVYVVDNLY